jgi:hypothetical protein
MGLRSATPRPLARALLVCCTTLVAATVGASTPSTPAGQPAEQPEVLQYRWSLEGFGGRLARLFLPGSGNGTLTTGPGPAGKLQSELLITSRDSAAGEFWRYGAEIDPATLAAVRAWSSYRFRGKSNSKELPVAGDGAVDVSAAIHLIRHAPPKAPMPLQIWSDGHLYPVEVLPGVLERMRLDGHDTLVRRYTIEGVEKPGERLWKGRLELVLEQDGTHVPVEIVVRVSLASLRLKLVDGDDPEEPAG